ncbi:sigma-54-dependent Fis family transcriptional regulator [Sediminispirochaeta smaragdinae]|uniref:GAF modulated sigma54 specific transcriptional regulator, Fis family n=1 Tax=Sediminispirochaeta smaragdinae (strain DSM 11293 / JCM 15392 / SEBR 4228) TaxID=573413 RepID=E1R4K7_SEDSS|nr:sigma-54-dependent Fis family transcriptional regulator [Sediminispirochaeta smaragdinae]ADK81748.1 GAF modulated sigma54 specific transcriptional regulator, Fis family [Sediminispirochaeta smaragdinae DSM 11293]
MVSLFFAKMIQIRYTFVTLFWTIVLAKGDVIMESIATETKVMWERFITKGRIEEGALRKEITEAWIRCINASVDPFADRSSTVLPQPFLNEILKHHKTLIDIARPFMENLYQFVAGSGFVVILCDEKGYLMEAVGDNDVLYGDHGLNLQQGAWWAEEEVGNNGVGTALRLKRPFQVSGAEHFCRKHHPWTCSGAPIFDDSGRVIAVLEMSGPVEKTHLHTLGMVAAGVEAIQQQMRVKKQNRELTVLNNSLNNIFLTVSDGVIVIDSRGAVDQVNPAAENILHQSAEKLAGHPFQEYIDNWHPIHEMLEMGTAFHEIELSINDGDGAITCLTSAKPIKDGGGTVTGGVIFINPITRIKKLINRFSGAHASFTFDDIIGCGQSLSKAIHLAKLVADNESIVLLSGESGTGKEMFAQAIHNKSNRRKGPFVAVNCGAIPRELIESELFGYVEGAFTGARKRGKPGKFELASGGTLFLDEIGEMPLEQQVALLRVLQDKSLTRIGGDKTVMIDTRIICATNKNLQLEVARGTFRQDLYYRLNVISIHLPPLREHREDIPTMFEVFLENACKRIGVKVPRINDEVMQRLQCYDWPGNVREFRNVVERVVNITAGSDICPENLPDEILSPRKGLWPSPMLSEAQNFDEERKKIKALAEKKEQEEILAMLYKHNGNVSQAAREMGISRNSLYRKMHKQSD